MWMMTKFLRQNESRKRTMEQRKAMSKHATLDGKRVATAGTGVSPEAKKHEVDVMQRNMS